MLKNIKTHIEKINIRLLLIAIPLSFLLWFICMNFADPVTYRSFTLSLKLINETDLTYNLKLIENRRELDVVTVKVQVTGLSSELDSLIADSTIYAYVDLNSSELVYVPNSKIGVPIPVRIGIGFKDEAAGGNFNVTVVSPETIGIVMDRIQEKSFNVHINRTGTLPAGYIAMGTEQDIRSVTVRGPSTVINRIARLGVEVDLTDMRTDIAEVLPVIAYDEYNEIVQGFETDKEAVSFKIPVYKTSVIQVQIGEQKTNGIPAANVVVTGVNVEPRSFEIAVHVDEVEQIGAITLEAPDVTGITKTTVFTYDINEYLQKINKERGLDLMLIDKENGEVRVTVMTEPVITREFEISVDKGIHFSGEASLANRRRQVLTEYVTIALTGIESVINGISANDITGRVDATLLAGLEDGEYMLEISWFLPEGTKNDGGMSVVEVLLTSPETGNQPEVSTPAPGADSTPAPGTVR